MIEPLVEVNYARKEFVGVLAERWEFQGNKWVFHLKKGVRFHDGSPFTAKDVVYSINRIKNDKQSLQRDNFRDVTELQAADEYTVVVTTETPNAVIKRTSTPSAPARTNS
jgi:peptide/nickel transport system substrate-binding protein